MSNSVVAAYHRTLSLLPLMREFGAITSKEQIDKDIQKVAKLSVNPEWRPLKSQLAARTRRLLEYKELFINNKEHQELLKTGVVNFPDCMDMQLKSLLPIDLTQLRQLGLKIHTMLRNEDWRPFPIGHKLTLVLLRIRELWIKQNTKERIDVEIEKIGLRNLILNVSRSPLVNIAELPYFQELDEAVEASDLKKVREEILKEPDSLFSRSSHNLTIFCAACRNYEGGRKSEGRALPVINLMIRAGADVHPYYSTRILETTTFQLENVEFPLFYAFLSDGGANNPEDEPEAIPQTQTRGMKLIIRAGGTPNLVPNFISEISFLRCAHLYSRDPRFTLLADTGMDINPLLDENDMQMGFGTPLNDMQMGFGTPLFDNVDNDDFRTSLIFNNCVVDPFFQTLINVGDKRRNELDELIQIRKKVISRYTQVRGSKSLRTYFPHDVTNLIADFCKPTLKEIREGCYQQLEEQENADAKEKSATPRPTSFSYGVIPSVSTCVLLLRGAIKESGASSSQSSSSSSRVSSLSSPTTVNLVPPSRKRKNPT